MLESQSSSRGVVESRYIYGTGILQQNRHSFSVTITNLSSHNPELGQLIPLPPIYVTENHLPLFSGCYQ